MASRPHLSELGPKVWAGVLWAALAVAGALANACTGLAVSSEAPLVLDGSPSNGGGDAGSADGPLAIPTDASFYDHGGASTIMGNPLCAVQASQSTCNPDLPGDLGVASCSMELGLDGGADGGFDGGAIACRVTEVDGGAAPTCSLAGTGTDGAMCNRSSDCAAGYDCVGDATSGGPGTCRHYCCDTLCGGPDAGVYPTESSPYCDLQPLYSNPTQLVPVCMESPSCQPLTPGQCPDKETCAIVDPNGRTACVPIGPGNVGDQCVTQHCGENLTCWGTSPMLTCVQLCDPTAVPGTCPAGTTCRTNASNFQNQNVGVCLPSH